jgi:hypothetical protein
MLVGVRVVGWIGGCAVRVRHGLVFIVALWVVGSGLALIGALLKWRRHTYV